MTRMSEPSHALPVTAGGKPLQSWTRSRLARAVHAPLPIVGITSALGRSTLPMLPMLAAMAVLAANGYPDVFVDLLYVASTTDAHLDWVERLLAR